MRITDPTGSCTEVHWLPADDYPVRHPHDSPPEASAPAAVEPAWLYFDALYWPHLAVQYGPLTDASRDDPRTRPPVPR